MEERENQRIKQKHPNWFKMKLERRELIRLRYEDFLRWEDAAERLWGDDPTFWDKQDIFVRRTFKIHRLALEELSKIVPLQ